MNGFVWDPIQCINKKSKCVVHDDNMGDANQSWESGGTAGALPAERARASFSTETMITLLDGGKRNTLRRRWIQSVHADDGNHLSSDRHAMSREQLTAASAKQFLEIHVPIAKKGEFKASGQDIAWMSEASVSFGPISPREYDRHYLSVSLPLYPRAPAPAARPVALGPRR